MTAERLQDPNSLRRTKIVATVGPASQSQDMIGRLLGAGVDVFRLNFSHGAQADHAQVAQHQVHVRAVVCAGLQQGDAFQLVPANARCKESGCGLALLAPTADRGHRRGAAVVACLLAGWINAIHHHRFSLDDSFLA